MILNLGEWHRIRGLEIVAIVTDKNVYMITTLEKHGPKTYGFQQWGAQCGERRRVKRPR